MSTYLIPGEGGKGEVLGKGKVKYSPKMSTFSKSEIEQAEKAKDKVNAYLDDVEM